MSSANACNSVKANILSFDKDLSSVFSKVFPTGVIKALDCLVKGKTGNLSFENGNIQSGSTIFRLIFVKAYRYKQQHVLGSLILINTAKFIIVVLYTGKLLQVVLMA